MAIQPTPTNYVALDLLTWHEEGKLVLSPKFQRRLVWKPAAKSYFIDTLLRGYPIPPIHIRLSSQPGRGAIREVVDGQQRLRTLFDFVAGKLRLGRQIDAPWAGRTFTQLDPDLQESLRLYKFYVYQYENLPDQTILEIFARINTYSVPLNQQELRNGKYFGPFKSTVYQLGLDYLSFWRTARVFTESAIARMQEAELTSELLILQLDGLQDKKASIDEFYSHLDNEWSDQPAPWTTRRGTHPSNWLSRKETQRRFQITLDTLNDAVGDILPSSEFNRIPLFYTLYSTIYHRLFGVPSLRVHTPMAPLQSDSVIRLREAIEVLSEMLSEGSPAEEDSMAREFFIASSRQTDNYIPRLRRFEILWSLANLDQDS